MLGVLARATGLILPEFLEKGLRWKLTGTAAETNIAALRAGYGEASVKITRGM
jgi:Pyruvate/2-oxoacid:ferredoxin oxidoreductase gamma subunit